MTDDEVKHGNRFWWVRYWVRRIWFRITKCFDRISKSRFLAGALPLITGSYYLILDVWGDKWSWVSDNQTLHEKIFIGCLAASLLSLFLRVFQHSAKIDSDETANTLLNNFIATVGAIVEAKTQRFRTKSVQLKHNSNKFNHITQPEEQFRVIGNAVSSFVCNSFGISEDAFDLTIMRKKPGANSWHYIYQHQSWSHSDPNALLNGSSAASKCCETKEHTFFPDKYKSARDKQYTLSPRDKRRGPGSAFIYPASFEARSGSDSYIVSIVTYGKQLCDDWDQPSVAVSASFLREFCRRIELELALHTIKHMEII